MLLTPIYYFYVECPSFNQKLEDTQNKQFDPCLKDNQNQTGISHSEFRSRCGQMGSLNTKVHILKDLAEKVNSMY